MTPTQQAVAVLVAAWALGTAAMLPRARYHHAARPPVVHVATDPPGPAEVVVRVEHHVTVAHHHVVEHCHRHRVDVATLPAVGPVVVDGEVVAARELPCR